MPSRLTFCEFSFLIVFSFVLSDTVRAEVTFTHGVASGDVKPFSAVLWTRVNQEATLQMEFSTDPTFPQSSTRSQIAVASADNDFTAKVVAAPLRPG